MVEITAKMVAPSTHDINVMINGEWDEEKDIRGNAYVAGVTYLQRKYKNAKIIGMCHGYAGVYRLAKAMGLDREDITFEVAGVNHFIWRTSFRYKGQDAYPLLDKWLEEHYEEHCKEIGNSAETGPKPVDLYRRYGLFPIGDTANPGGGAWGWEYHSDEDIEKQFKEDPLGWYEWYFKIMMDPWTRSRKQAEKLLDDIFALPCNADMKEYYK